MSDIATKLRELLGSAPRGQHVTVTTDDVSADPRGAVGSGEKSMHGKTARHESRSPGDSSRKEEEEEEPSLAVDEGNKGLANKRQKMMFGRRPEARGSGGGSDGGHRISKRTLKKSDTQGQSSWTLIAPKFMEQPEKSESQSESPRYSSPPSQTLLEREKEQAAAAAASSYGVKRESKRFLGRVLGGGYKLGKRGDMSFRRGDTEPPMHPRWHPSNRRQRDEDAAMPLQSDTEPPMPPRWYPSNRRQRADDVTMPLQGVISLRGDTEPPMPRLYPSNQRQRTDDATMPLRGITSLRSGVEPYPSYRRQSSDDVGMPLQGVTSLRGGAVEPPMSRLYSSYRRQRTADDATMPLRERVSSARAAAAASSIAAVAEEGSSLWAAPLPGLVSTSPQREEPLRNGLHTLNEAITANTDMDKDMMDPSSGGPKVPLFSDPVREELEIKPPGDSRDQEIDADGTDYLSLDEAQMLLTDSPMSPAHVGGFATAMKDYYSSLSGPDPQAYEMSTPGPGRILQCIIQVEALNDGCQPPGCLSQQQILTEKKRCRQSRGSDARTAGAGSSDFSRDLVSETILILDPSSPPSSPLSAAASRSRFGGFNEHENNAGRSVSEDMMDLFPTTDRGRTENKDNAMPFHIQDLKGSGRIAPEKGNPLFVRQGVTDVDDSPYFVRADQGLEGTFGKSHISSRSLEPSLQDEVSQLYTHWLFSSNSQKKLSQRKKMRDSVASRAEMLNDKAEIAKRVRTAELEPSAVLANLEQQIFRLRAAIDELSRHKKHFIWKNPRGYSTMKRAIYNTDDGTDGTTTRYSTMKRAIYNTDDGTDGTTPFTGRSYETLHAPQVQGQVPRSDPRDDPRQKSADDLLRLDKRGHISATTPFVDRRFESYSPEFTAALLGSPDPQIDFWQALAGNLYLAKRGYSYNTPLVDRRFEAYSPQLLAALAGLFRPHGGLWDSPHSDVYFKIKRGGHR